MDDREVMAFEDLAPVSAGQVWRWTSPITLKQSTYCLLHDVSDEDHEVAWNALDLEDGRTKYVYSVNQNTSWKRLA